MSEKITKINDSNFDALVIIPKKPTVVFFSASWNAPSRMARPILETAAEKYSQKVKIYEMDVDENSIVPTAYAVRNLPAILTFAGGQLIDIQIGAVTRDKLNEKIEKIADSGELYKNMLAFSKKLAVGFGKRFGV